MIEIHVFILQFCELEENKWSKNYYLIELGAGDALSFFIQHSSSSSSQSEAAILGTL